MRVGARDHARECHAGQCFVFCFSWVGWTRACPVVAHHSHTPSWQRPAVASEGGLTPSGDCIACLLGVCVCELLAGKAEELELAMLKASLREFDKEKKGGPKGTDGKAKDGSKVGGPCGGLVGACGGLWGPEGRTWGLWRPVGA